MFSRTSSGRARKAKPKDRRRLTDKTAKATGYCARSVRRVVAENDYCARSVRRVVVEERASDGAAFVLPAKRYKRDRKRIVVDTFPLALSLPYVV